MPFLQKNSPLSNNALEVTMSCLNASLFKTLPKKMQK